jgi:Asp-tRNA(Asn)/Glu-tRNA(Gln) amidotransferase A subunit family amidase
MSLSLAYITAIEATRLFRDRQLSPVDLLKAQIAASELIEPKINAFSHTFFDQALDQARASEARWNRGEPRGPLDGVPVVIKDELDVAGQPNTEGSLIYRDNIAKSDATLVARLRAAGAIFHARGTCPEFCTLWNTHSKLFGVTRNPWNLDITPGGSSGGSGASLAAGTTTLATGSDIGGSIRFPASQCGLVGFKPPFGRVPEDYTPFDMEPYCANGPMGRTVSDVALMQNVISGPQVTNAATTLPKVILPLDYPDNLEGKRIAFSMDFGHLEVEDDIQRNTREMLKRLESLGATVVEVDLPWGFEMEAAYDAHMDPLFFSHIASELEKHPNEVCDYNMVMALAAKERMTKDSSAFYRAACLESQMYEQFAKTMVGFDAFVSPTVTSNQMRADFNPAHEETMVNGKAQPYDLCISTTHYFNMMGRCPSMSVPSGIGDNGVPTGLQIAALAYDDLAVFEVAAALESSWDQPFIPPRFWERT